MPFWFGKSHYEKVQATRGDSDDEDTVRSQDAFQQRSTSLGTGGAALKANLYPILIATLLSITLLSGVVLWSYSFAVCTQAVPQGSPLMRDLEILYQERRFNGSLLKENIYRQTASTTVDAAWEALGVNCKASPIHI